MYINFYNFRNYINYITLFKNTDPQYEVITVTVKSKPRDL